MTARTESRAGKVELAVRVKNSSVGRSGYRETKSVLSYYVFTRTKQLGKVKNGWSRTCQVGEKLINTARETLRTS